MYLMYYLQSKGHFARQENSKYDSDGPCHCGAYITVGNTEENTQA